MYCIVDPLTEDIRVAMSLWCCKKTNRNSISDSSMDNTTMEMKTVKRFSKVEVLQGSPVEIRKKNNKDITQTTASALPSVRDDSRDLASIHKKPKPVTDDTITIDTHGGPAVEAEVQLQTSQSGQNDVTDKCPRPENNIGVGETAASALTSVQDDKRDDVGIYKEAKMDTDDTINSHEGNRQVEPSTAACQSVQGQSNFSDVHAPEIAPVHTTPQSTDHDQIGAAAAASSNVDNKQRDSANSHQRSVVEFAQAAANSTEQQKLVQKAVIPRGQRYAPYGLPSQDRRLHISRQLEQSVSETRPFTEHAARNDQSGMSDFRPDADQTNPHRAEYQEVTTRAVALSGPRSVQSTRNRPATIPYGHTVTIQEFDRTMTTEHGERVPVKGRHTVVERPGELVKVGRRRYYVRTEETQVGTWLDWLLGNQAQQTSQQSYFGSESEDEDEKEYLKAAAENLDMNW